MIELHTWMDDFLRGLRETFGDRIYFVGLQGSYGRGEATEASDIDPVVILDELSCADIRTYHRLLDTLPHRERICGFLSGREELLRWEASDLFQFYYDTKPVQGSLAALLPRIDGPAVERAIRLGVCNIYHGCVHNMLYERDEALLRGLYKSASFVVQAICFQQTGRYPGRQAELPAVAEGAERAVMETFLALKRGGPVEFDRMSEQLFRWAQGRIQS